MLCMLHPCMPCIIYIALDMCDLELMIVQAVRTGATAFDTCEQLHCVTECDQHCMARRRANCVRKLTIEGHNDAEDILEDPTMPAMVKAAAGQCSAVSAAACWRSASRLHSWT